MSDSGSATRDWGENQIAARQNEARFLELQAAKNWLYDRARSVGRVQIWVAVVAPLVLSAGQAIEPNLAPWVPLYAVLALFISPELDAWQQRLRAHAALVQEVFDRDLLDMKWPDHAVGTRPSVEDVRRWARRYSGRASEWKDWYPPAVGQLPLPIARIACQRTNSWWDSTLRKRYANYLAVGGYGVVGIVFLVGAVRQQTILQVMAVTSLLAPVVSWILRERRRQRATADGRERLAEWTQSLEGRWRAKRVDDEFVNEEAEEIQRATYKQRVEGALIPRWLYRWSRAEHEDAVRAATDALVQSKGDAATQ